MSCDDKDTAWKILGGYQFNRHFAVELGYTDLGEASASGFGVNAAIEATAFEVVAVGIVPIADKFSVVRQARHVSGRHRIRPATWAVNESETNNDLTFGFGVRYDFTKNLGVRAEWQKYQDVGGGEIGETDVDVISIGVIWKF